MQRVWLLWVFRNFRILHFSVLSRREQHFITQLWQFHSTADDSAFADLIGTIEGFSPSPDQACAPDQPSNTRPLTLPSRDRRLAYALVAIIGVLLAVVISMWPAHKFTRTAVIKRTTKLSSAASSLPAVSSPEPSRAGQQPYPQETTPPPAPTVTIAATPTRLRPVAKTQGKVIVRAAVDGEGRGHEFQVLRGDGELTSAAVQAAQRWHFQLCSRASGCEQLLEYTDYGDGATTLKLIRECGADEPCYTASTRSAER